LRELLQAKVEQRAPQIEIATEGKAKPEVVNIMTALKKSMKLKVGRRCVIQFGGEWASLRKRNSQGRERHDPDQARAERRIEEQLDVALRRWK
jgi:hypothetical protein